MVALHTPPVPTAVDDTAPANSPEDAGDVRRAVDVPTRERIASFLDPRAASVDSCAAAVRDGVSYLSETLSIAGDDTSPNHHLDRVAATIATAAGSCMSSAFSLWCHRMVLEYVSRAPRGSRLRRDVLPALIRTELLGSTALAAAMAHHVCGAPLPVEWRREGDDLVLDGRINWASNLFPPGFILVTAAARADTGGAGDPLILAIPGAAAGLEIQPYPQLLALQATGSSSIVLRDVHIPTGNLIADDFTPFIAGVRPTFLLLQSSFCWGLAHAALAEARLGLRGIAEVFQDDLESLASRAHTLGSQLSSRARVAGAGTPIREIVRARLDCAQLATAAVALEAKIAGGRGYVRTCTTARRLREAAFLPVQAPTEGQLRWELSRSA